MKLRRLITLTTTATLAALLSACGGGGETGPAWAKDAKAELTEEVFVSYYGVCFNIGDYPVRDVLTRVAKTGTVEVFKEEYRFYKGSTCDEANPAFAYRLPDLTLQWDGTEAVDAATGYTAKQVTASRTASATVFTALANDIVFKQLEGDKTSANWPARNDPEAIELPNTYEAELYKDLYLNRAGKIYFGNRNGVQTDAYPTKLNSAVSELFSIEP
jgi:hypothetical protein